MKLVIGCDHAGYELRDYLVERLEAEGYTVKDYGTDGPDSVDYPDFAHPVSLEVANETADLGILICGSANGMAMTANKHEDIRCALCWRADVAELARQHNNANMIALPARFITKEEGWEIVSAFLHASFEGGRHERRVNKIPC